MLFKTTVHTTFQPLAHYNVIQNKENDVDFTLNTACIEPQHIIIMLPIICFFCPVVIVIIRTAFQETVTVYCTNNITVIDAFARECPFCAVPVSCYIAQWILLQS